MPLATSDRRSVAVLADSLSPARPAAPLAFTPFASCWSASRTCSPVRVPLIIR